MLNCIVSNCIFAYIFLHLIKMNNSNRKWFICALHFSLCQRTHVKWCSLKLFFSSQQKLKFCNHLTNKQRNETPTKPTFQKIELKNLWNWCKQTGTNRFFFSLNIYEKKGEAQNALYLLEWDFSVFWMNWEYWFYFCALDGAVALVEYGIQSQAAHNFIRSVVLKLNQKLTGYC